MLSHPRVLLILRECGLLRHGGEIDALWASMHVSRPSRTERANGGPHVQFAHLAYDGLWYGLVGAVAQTVPRHGRVHHLPGHGDRGIPQGPVQNVKVLMLCLHSTKALFKELAG